MISHVIVLCFAALLSSSLLAETPILNDYNNSFIPHLIAGGEWKSEAIITNHADTPRDVAFLAFKQDGLKWEWALPQFSNQARANGPFSTMYYLTTLAAKETRSIRFERDAEAEFGWAMLASCFTADKCGDVSGYILLRNHNPARMQDFELSYPFVERSSGGATMFFDQTNWSQMVLNIANAADTVPWETDATFDVRVFNEAGAQVFQKDVFVKKGGTVIINMAHESQALWGVRGRVDVRVKSGNTYLFLSGIRINDTGSFTPVSSMTFR